MTINLIFTLEAKTGRPVRITLPFALNEVLSGMAGEIIVREYPDYKIAAIEVIN